MTELYDLLDQLRGELGEHRAVLRELTVGVTRLVAQSEARAETDALRRANVDGRLERHSDAVRALRTDAPARAAITVARWQAAAVIGAAALTGGALTALVRVLGG